MGRKLIYKKLVGSWEGEGKGVLEEERELKKRDTTPVTFHCDTTILDNFRLHCLGRNVSPNKTLEKMMKEYNDRCLKQDLRGL